MNNSSTGGFISPHPQTPELVTKPPGLTLVQFIQTLLTGLSELPGTLVRPEWQVEPPKQPDLSTNWLAFGVKSATPDSNAYVGFDEANQPYLQRNELVQVALSFYGPNAYDNWGLVRDGLQLTQNLSTLRLANIGFAYDSPAQHVPDLVNGRFVDRYVAELFFRRQVIRTYPILSFVSANGTIYTQTAVDDDFTQNFKAGS